MQLRTTLYLLNILDPSRSPDRNQACIDLNAIENDLQEIADLLSNPDSKGASLESQISDLYSRINKDCAALSTLIGTSKDFSPLEVNLMNGMIGEARTITWTPPQAMVQNPTEYSQICEREVGRISLVVQLIANGQDRNQ